MVTGRKGCFDKTTKILTGDGYKLIPTIEVGDIVYSFNRDTYRIEQSRVTEVYKHTWEETNAKLLEIVHTNGSIKVTDNHWIYLKGHEPEFVEAGELKVGDILTGANKQNFQIIEINELPEVEYTYNLEITPNNTLIANGIRVHNKGGGKSKSTRVSQEEANNIGSNSIVKIVDLISEGPIEGFVNKTYPGNSIYFDDTPLVSVTGSNNYDNMTLGFRQGLPAQSMIPGFETSEEERQVGVVVLKSQNVPRSITSGYDAVRVTIRFNGGLLKQDKTTGDIKGTTVQWKIDTSKDGGIWSTVINKSLNRKSNSAFELDYVVPNPHKDSDDLSRDAFYVRVVRVTNDSTTSNVQDEFSFERMTLMVYSQETYPDSAIVGVAADAESTGGAIPSRSFEVFGLQCQVPHEDFWTPDSYDDEGNLLQLGEYKNYDWDGTFANELTWTQDPIWIVYNLLTNDRYGLGLDESSIDIYSFFQASTYCMEAVDDGNGGSEHRFTFNGVISRQDDAYKVIQTIASVGRCQLYDTGGLIKIVQDRPTDSTAVFNNSNVVGGVFTYEYAEKTARPTACDVTYSDSEDRYLPRTIRLESGQDAIDAYGYNVLSVAGQGITSEGQAQRFSAWSLNLANNSGKTVKFGVGIESTFVEVGDVVDVSDHLFTDTQNNINEYAGRVISNNGLSTSIELDRDVDLTTGPYKIFVHKRQGSLENIAVVERDIIETNIITNTVTFSEAIELNIGDPWIVVDTSSESKEQYKVTSVQENNTDTTMGFIITGMKYDPDRFDDSVNIDPFKFKDISTTEVLPPTGLYARRESVYDKENQIATSRLTILWEEPFEWVDKDTGQVVDDGDENDTTLLKRKDPSIAGYVVKWRQDGGQWTSSGIIQNSSFRIDGVTPGLYEYYVRTVNVRNIESPPVSDDYLITMDDVISTSLDTPYNVGTNTGLVYDGSQATIRWQYFLDQDEAHLDVNNETVFKDFVVEIFGEEDDPFNDEPRGSYTVDYREGQTYQWFTFTYQMNKDAFDESPRRDFQVIVRSRDTYNLTNSPQDLVSKGQPILLTNPLPTTPVVDRAATFDSVTFSIEPTNKSYNYVILRDTVPPAINENNIIASGRTDTFTIRQTEDNMYYKIAAADGLVTLLNTENLLKLNWNTFGNQPISPLVPDFQQTDYAFTEVLFNINDMTLQWPEAQVAQDSDSVTIKTIPAGSYTLPNGDMDVHYIYYDFDNNIITQNTDLSTALASGRSILGTFRFNPNIPLDGGGTGKAVFTTGGATGDAFIDGNRILAQTIGADQLFVNEAVITGPAQLANAIITEAKIDDAAITNAKIDDAAITNAKIQNAAIDRLKIKDRTITNVRSVMHGPVAGIGIDAIDKVSSGKQELIIPTVPTTTITGTDVCELIIQFTGLFFRSSSIRYVNTALRTIKPSASCELWFYKNNMTTPIKKQIVYDEIIQDDVNIGEKKIGAYTGSFSLVPGDTYKIDLVLYAENFINGTTAQGITKIRLSDFGLVYNEVYK